MNPNTPTPIYETFCDTSYYDQWCVRRVGEKRWGYCYHVPSKEEAEGLMDTLSMLERELADLRAEVERLKGLDEIFRDTLADGKPVQTYTISRQDCDRYQKEFNQLRARVAELTADNTYFRLSCALASAGMKGYYDDGEMQDNTAQPWIDWKRDSVETIKASLLKRNSAAIDSARAKT